MLLYRVEHPESKLGPYQHTHHTDDIDRMIDQHNDDPDFHPSPRNDIGRWLDEGVERCAFASRQQMAEWFDEWLPTLADHGFHCVKLQVDPQHAIIGRTQVIYTADKANLISSISLKELL